jgi:rod shape-determining protein MreD
MRLGEYARPIIRPISSRWIIAGFVLSCIIEWLTPNYPRWIPDFALLFLCHWCLYQPDSMSIPKSLILAIFMDAVTVSSFGQHVFGYTLTAFVLLSEQRRLLALHFWQQAVVVAFLHFIHYTLMALSRWLIDQMPFPTGIYWFPVLSGTALWVIISWSIQIWQHEN